MICYEQQKSPWFYPCSIALWTFLQLGNASTMEVNTDWKSLRIFIFMNLKRPLNCLKNKMTKIKENLSKTIKQCPKKKCIQISYKKCPISPVIGSVYREVAIERSILRGNVNCDLKWCSLESDVRYKVSAT